MPEIDDKSHVRPALYARLRNGEYVYRVVGWGRNIDGLWLKLQRGSACVYTLSENVRVGTEENWQTNRPAEFVE